MISWVSSSTAILSRLLQPQERETVLGDFAETGESGLLALRDVLGLLLRRQTAIWADWRPWLSLFGLIVPCGMLLSIISWSTSFGSAVYVWMYANNWRLADVGNSGFRHLFAETAASVLLSYLGLFCWSWSSGFVLGFASRGLVRVNGVVFCLMLLFGQARGAPEYFAYVWQRFHHAIGVASSYSPNDAVFALTFYRVIFPALVQTFLVVIPSLWGLRRGADECPVRPFYKTALRLVAIAALAAMLIQNRYLWPFFGSLERSQAWESWPMHLAEFVVYWPIAYLFASAIARRSGKMASA